MWTWSCRSAFQNHSQSQGVVFCFFFVCVCVCVLYYKFILYITRGAPNKAVKKKKDRRHQYIADMNRVMNSVYYRFQESLHSRA